MMESQGNAQKQGSRECRMCGSRELGQVFYSKSCPRFSHKNIREERLQKDAKVEIEVMECKACGLVQIGTDYPPEEYVDDYQRNISFSPTAVAHVEAFADALTKLGARNLIEVGCGNGLFCAAMLKRGAKVVAFEPSAAASRAAKERGAEVHNRFFDETIPQQFSGYDSFALRFVLEHVPQPLHILKLIASRCKDGAVGLIEVPNAEKQIREKRWFDFIPEHTIYFTPKTLMLACYKAGLGIVEMRTTVGEEFLTAIVRKGTFSSPKDWGVDGFERELKALFGPGKRVWGYGASGGGVTILSECGIDSRMMEFVVDSDKNKWGLYASGSRIRIVPPEEVASGKPDGIIILSSAYEKEIVQSLREKGFAGRIASLFPHPRWIE